VHRSACELLRRSYEEWRRVEEQGMLTRAGAVRQAAVARELEVCSRG
jgi:hypothetical protein